MSKYLKKFETQAAYEAAHSGLILPNVSLTVDNNTVHYNPSSPVPPTETRIVAKYNVTSTSDPTSIGFSSYTSGFSAIEIDGVELPSVVSAYTFSTTGEHTVKYTLTDPTSIGNYVFAGCTSITSITIPNSVTSIGDYAFDYCNGLTSIGLVGSGASLEIPNNITSIGNYAFAESSGLVSVVLPNFTSIGISVFYNCTSLISITSNATTAPTISSSTFFSINQNGTLYVPTGSSGYDVWMSTGEYYLGFYNWTKIEQ